VELVARQADRVRQALAASILLGCVLAVIWMLSCLPVVRTRVRLLWPEEAALLGIACWSVFGPGWVFLFLVVLGVCGRTLLVAGWVAARLRRHGRESGSGLRGPLWGTSS
jgi:hypothetical protein